MSKRLDQQTNQPKGINNNNCSDLDPNSESVKGEIMLMIEL